MLVFIPFWKHLINTQPHSQNIPTEQHTHVNGFSAYVNLDTSDTDYIRLYYDIFNCLT